MIGRQMFIWLILDVQEGSKHLDPQGDEVPGLKMAILLCLCENLRKDCLPGRTTV